MSLRTITPKLLIGAAALSLPLIVMSLWGVNDVKNLRAELEGVSRVAGQQPALVRLEMSIHEFLMPGNELLVVGNIAGETVNFRKFDKKLTEAVENFKASGLTDEELGLSQAELEENLARMRELGEKIMALAKPKGNHEGLRMMKQMDALAVEIAGKINDAAARLPKKTEAQLDRFSQEVTRIVGVLALLPLAILLAALIATARVYRWMVVPIKKTLEAFRLLAEGDLTGTLFFGGSDEVGQMGGAFNTAMEKLRQPLGLVRANIGALSASAEELSAVSRRMTEDAAKAAAQVNAVSSASVQVSANVQTVASSGEEMTSSIKEISRNAAAAAKVAGDAVKLSQQAGATMAVLGESSVEIGKVVNLITAIAGKTNLLALNASIEAASAGEAGRGFAVVATEVKELARAAAKATDEISRKIEGMQAGTKGALEAISQIGAVIHQISDISNTIASAIEEQSVTTSEIGRNVSEASKGSAEISRSISGMAEATSGSSSAAASAQSASEQLFVMAADLRKLVGAFKC